jgi:hypothetical protein
MKKIITLICLVTLLPKIIFGEDSVTLRISCTIPAIPGVNAPPLPEVAKEEKTKTDEQDTQKSSGKIVVMEKQDQVSEEKEREINQAPIFIVEEEIKDLKLSNTETKRIALKTIYSR